MSSDRRPVKFKAENLDFFYGTTRALKNVTIECFDRKVTAIIGPSGCGKSTFIRTLNRMNDVIAGTRIGGRILLDGKDIYAPDVDVVELRRRVGMVFQKPNPFPKSIYDNIAYGLRINGMKDKRKIEETVEKSLRGAALWDEVRTASTTTPSPFRGGSSSASASPGPWPSSRRSSSSTSPARPSIPSPRPRSRT